MQTPAKQKVAVIRKEMVALTGDYRLAIVLGQLLSELVKDWVNKTAAEMIDETMMNVSDNTMCRYFEYLMKLGYIHRRRNPKYKWDHTYQYRVDLCAVLRDVTAKGYSLTGYSLEEQWG